MAVGALVGALAVGALGCGSSERSLRSADFVQRADAICRTAEQRTYAVLRGTLGAQAATHTAERAKLAADLTAVMSKEANQLGALQPPAALRSAFDDYKSVLNESQQALAARIGNAATLMRQDPHQPGTAAYAQARREGALTQRALALQAKLGLHVCH